MTSGRQRFLDMGPAFVVIGSILAVVFTVLYVLAQAGAFD
jgi:hypothetical protein